MTPDVAAVLSSSNFVRFGQVLRFTRTNFIGVIDLGDVFRISYAIFAEVGVAFGRNDAGRAPEQVNGELGFIDGNLDLNFRP